MRVRSLYLWHRYLGIALGLLFAVWFVSGVVMLYVRMPILFPEERLALLPSLDPGAARIAPARAVDRAHLGEAPRRMRLAALLGRPIYYILPGGRRWVGVFADTGEVLQGVTPDAAVRIATAATGVAAPRYVSTVAEIDQWTLTAWDKSWILPGDRHAPARGRFETRELTRLAARMMPGHHLVDATRVDRYDAYYYSVGAVGPKRLPVLRLTFDDPSRTWFYVDPHTGSIIRRYDRYGRVMRWAVNGLHSLDFPLLFRHGRAWDVTVIALSAGGLLLSVSGLVIGWRRLRWPA